MAQDGVKTAAVTGATGFVGRHMVQMLLDRGHRVRAMARDAEKASRVLGEHDHLEIVEGRVLDGETPEALVRGADVCVHLIGIIREAGNGQTFNRMHVEATRAMVRACEAQGVGRYLQMSALGVRPDGVSAYQKTKFEAEKSVRRSSLDWTIFRPGMIVGKDGDFFNQMKRWCESRELPYFFMPYFLRTSLDVTAVPPVPSIEAPQIAPIDVDDVCRAFCDSIDNRATFGEIYPLVGAQVLTWPEMLRMTRDALPQSNKQLKAVGIPATIAAAKAQAFKLIGLGALLPFDEGMARMGGEDSIASTEKAAWHLEFVASGYEEKLPEYVKA
ncbi:MAG: NAD(P)H-binding protein [Planctomycetota bacterium]